jgi:hypothetical protein
MPKRNPDLERNRALVIEYVFKKVYQPGVADLPFTLKDIEEAIAAVSAANPKYVEGNKYDVKYEFASGRQDLPASIDNVGPWMIGSRGKGKYAFVKLASPSRVQIPSDLAIILLPDATPEIVLEYAGSDEQGTLAKLHYNRLLDIYLQLTCYHLQNHWKTFVKGKGQHEIDDLYVGLNTTGKQYVIPVEAKCCGDHLNKTQVVQMIDFAHARYPKLIMRPVGVQEMSDGSMVFVEFTPGKHPDEIKIKEPRRYKLVAMRDVPLEAQQRDPLGG